MSKLIDAVSKGNLEEIKTLLQSGEDVNQKDEQYGTTALHAAAAQNNGDIAELLIKNRAEIDAKDYNGKTPLHTAAENDSALVIKILISHGAVNSNKDVSGKTAFILAYENSSIKSGSLLVNADYARTKSIFDYFRKIQSTSHSGRDNSKNTYENILLHAAKDGLVDVISALVMNGYSVNTQDENRNTLMHIGAQEGRSNVIQYLIKMGASRNNKNNNGLLPIQVVAQEYHKDSDNQNFLLVGKLLLQNESDDEAKAILEILNGDVCPLWKPAVEGNVSLLKKLLREGIDVNIADKEGNTVIHLAALHGHVKILKAFLLIRADVNIKNNAGETPLTIALNNHNLDFAKVLVKAGADPNLRDSKNGYTELHRLVLRQDETSYNKLKDLIAIGVDPNIKDKDGRTPLNLMMRNLPVARSYSKGFVNYSKGLINKILKTLLLAGADINTQDNNGYTPLHNAVINYILNEYSDNSTLAVWPKHTLLLTEKKPNYSIKDNDGFTSVELAYKFNCLEPIFQKKPEIFNDDIKDGSNGINDMILFSQYKRKIIDPANGKLNSVKTEIEHLYKKLEIAELTKKYLLRVSIAIAIVICVQADLREHWFILLSALCLVSFIIKTFVNEQLPRLRMGVEEARGRIEIITLSINKKFEEKTPFTSKQIESLSKNEFDLLSHINSKSCSVDNLIECKEKQKRDIATKCPQCGKLGAMKTKREDLGTRTEWDSEIRSYAVWDQGFKSSHAEVKQIMIPTEISRWRDNEVCRFCGHTIYGEICENRVRKEPKQNRIW